MTNQRVCGNCGEEWWGCECEVGLNNSLPLRRPKVHNRMFSDKAVISIRKQHAAGSTQTYLARKYGCSIVTIHSMVRMDTYQHVRRAWPSED